jgi:hypothetical protein
MHWPKNIFFNHKIVAFDKFKMSDLFHRIDEKLWLQGVALGVVAVDADG